MTTMFFFRVYKSAHAHKEVIHKINNDTGIHFDPTTVDACLTISIVIE